ncbi:uncharacterized protein [Nicotiana tomentosiformis]|uniref:uncharacterized protein n=1 Tax=Nicotiana tomentosiformis TaxID=4098 RepID=UPI00388C7884
MVERLYVDKTSWFTSTYWDQFSQLFLEKFIPFTLREDHRKRFEHLQQGSMTVTHYETQFVDLARHAIVLLPTERERVRRFIDGLTFSIRLQMAKESGDDISFQRTVDIARWIEIVCGQDRGMVSDKRPCHFGSFSGASSGDRGSFGRGCPPRTIQLALQVIIPVCQRDASVQFDSGSTYSYMSSYFPSYLIVPQYSLSAPVYVSTLLGDSNVVDHVYNSCVVSIGILETSVDLLLLDMMDFDVILGMDDCHTKTVTLAMPRFP